MSFGIKHLYDEIAELKTACVKHGQKVLSLERKLTAIRTITHRHYTTKLSELTEGKDEIYAHLKLVKELQKVLGYSSKQTKDGETDEN